MKIETVKKVQQRVDHALEHYWDQYEQAVEARAQLLMTTVIAPFLRSRQWKMLAGNGMWWMWDEHGRAVDVFGDRRDWSADKLYQAVREILDTPVYGKPADSLGTLMIVPEDVKYRGLE